MKNWVLKPTDKQGHRAALSPSIGNLIWIQSLYDKLCIKMDNIRYFKNKAKTC